MRAAHLHNMHTDADKHLVHPYISSYAALLFIPAVAPSMFSLLRNHIVCLTNAQLQQPTPQHTTLPSVAERIADCIKRGA
jgi:hypothetical protein